MDAGSTIPAGWAVLRVRWPVLLVSVATIVALPLWWSLSPPSSDLGVIPSVATRMADARLVILGPRVPVPLFEEVPTRRAVGVRSARLIHQAAPAPVSAPARISIGAIGVSARVVPVGINPRTGTMQVPSDVRTAGWYRFGSAPGEAGSTVVVGHVDSLAQGAGAFSHLRDLKVGDIIRITSSDAALSRYRVIGRRSYAKAALPDHLFDRTGDPRLVLITCGGPFDFETRHYADNVVVYAVPVAGGAGGD